MRLGRNGTIDDGFERRNQFHGFENGVSYDDASSTEGECKMSVRESFELFPGELLDQAETYCSLDAGGGI